MVGRKLSPIAKRISVALNADPVWDLAVELTNEGFDEVSLKPFCEEAMIDDAKRIKLLNYMRDIERGAKKPLR